MISLFWAWSLFHDILQCFEYFEYLLKRGLEKTKDIPGMFL